MAFRRLLAILDGGSKGKSVMQTAIAIGRLFDAHTEILHIRPVSGMILSGFGGGADAAVMPLADAFEREAAADMKRAAEIFDTCCVQPGLTVVPADAMPTSHEGPTFSWRAVDGHDSLELAQRGRLSDMVILAISDEAQGGVDSAILESALFETGRPVLLVGSEPPVLEGLRVAVAWDGSREAAHSVGFALPLLHRAQSVRIIAIGKDEPVASPADLAGYLAVHGIDAKLAPVASGGRNVGAVLLEEVAGEPTDLLVMGAYGRSALSEHLFGGVTRTILESADLPVVLAH